MTLARALALLYLGVVCSGVAWLAFLQLIREAGSVTASSVTYVMPPIALASDFLLFRAIPQPMEIVGSVIVFVGIFFVHRGSVGKNKFSYS